MPIAAQTTPPIGATPGQNAEELLARLDAAAGDGGEQAAPARASPAGGSSTLELDCIGAGETIEHVGTVLVRGKVEAQASVSVVGDLVVEGLIEDANLIVSGDLFAAGGIKGRDRATLKVGGSLEARFLDSIRGEVAQRAVVERETINCRLTVHGSFDAGSGSLISGAYTIGRQVSLGSLGSSSAAAVRLKLGAVPLLEPLLREMDPLIEQLEKQKSMFKPELDRLNMPGQRLNPAQKERQTELGFSMHTVETLLSRCLLAQDDARQRIRRLRTVDLTISGALHPGVVIECEGVALRLRNAVQGPLKIGRDPKGNLILRRAGEQSAIPLSRLAEVLPGS